MYKSQLQELCQRKLWKHPEYSSSRDGPDHDPCFSALVIVNGVSFQSSDICRTIKAAQNSAAELALNYYSGLGSGNGSNECSIGHNCLPSATQNGLEATLTLQSHTGNVMQSPLTHVGVKDKRNSLEGQNLYKNRLQDYAQKRNIGLPVYSCESQGPPHARKFKCKVTVGGQTYEATDFFPTIKEAECAAAKIAFEHVSPNEDLEVTSGSNKNLLQELAPKKGYFVPSYETEGTATLNGLEATLTVQSHTRNVMQSPLTHLPVNDKRNSLEGQHLYKSRLQEYAQKRNIGFPVYSCEFQGPPHAREFKCKVTIGGQTYEAPDFFPTIKEAECAAAKIAFAHVSPNEDLEAQSDSYKKLLQELAQKRGYFVPTYKTEGTGPSHLPVFVATIEVANKVYQGLPASSKKKAEANAAKSAYDSLQSEPLHSNEQHQQNGYTKVNQQTGPMCLSGQHQQNGYTMENTPMAVSAMKFEPHLKDSSPSKEIKEAILSEPTTNTSPMYYQQTTVTNGKSSRNPASRDHVPLQMILIYPRSNMPNLMENGNSSVLPCSDDKWVALKMDTTP